MTAKIVVAALYKFVSLPDYEALREPLLNTMVEHGVKGTLLLAEEGINGTVSGTRAGIDGLLDHAHVLLTDRLGGVQEDDGDLGLVDGALRAQHRVVVGAP